MHLWRCGGNFIHWFPTSHLVSKGLLLCCCCVAAALATAAPESWLDIWSCKFFSQCHKFPYTPSAGLGNFLAFFTQDYMAWELVDISISSLSKHGYFNLGYSFGYSNSSYLTRYWIFFLKKAIMKAVFQSQCKVVYFLLRYHWCYSSTTIHLNTHNNRTCHKVTTKTKYVNTALSDQHIHKWIPKRLFSLYIFLSCLVLSKGSLNPKCLTYSWHALQEQEVRSSSGINCYQPVGCFFFIIIFFIIFISLAGWHHKT